MSTERDTHFQGFAKLLWGDVRNKVHFVTNTSEEYLDERVIAIIAQRAYDLVCHTQQFMPGIEQIPDLTSWDEN